MQSVPRRGLLRTAALGVTCAVACAAPKETWRGAPPEVLVDVLPRIAELSVDGGPLGSGPHTVPVPDPAHVYVFRAADGRALYVGNPRLSGLAGSFVPFFVQGGYRLDAF